MNKIHHFYHIFASGMWETPTKEHIAELKRTDLINCLTTLNFGLVGKKEDRETVKQYLSSELNNFNICVEVDEGFEQETQDKIHEFCQNNDGYVYYAHSKNAMNVNALHIKWRKSMTYFTLVKWRDCVDLLNNGYSSAGSHYLLPVDGQLLPQMGVVKTVPGLYAGTFWWTKAKYIRNFSLPHREDRFGAEEWILQLHDVVNSLGEEFRAYDFNCYHPGADTYLVSSW